MNMQIEQSLKNGDTHTMSDGTTYRGKPPVYADINIDPLSPARIVKVQKGIPFVRVARR